MARVLNVDVVAGKHPDSLGQRYRGLRDLHPPSLSEWIGRQTTITNANLLHAQLRYVFTKPCSVTSASKQQTDANNGGIGPNASTEPSATYGSSSASRSSSLSAMQGKKAEGELSMIRYRQVRVRLTDGPV